MSGSVARSTTRGLPGRRAVRRVPFVAGIAYSLSWFVGLAVFSSSTQVRSSGSEILRSYTGHQVAVAVQLVLTEGTPAVFLAAVVWSFARTMVASAVTSPRLLLLGGLGAAAVSLVQLALGLWLSVHLVGRQDPGAVGEAFGALNRLDGVKMLLLAGMALVATRAIHHGDIPLPRWLTPVAAALAVTITLSAVGYLALDDAFALAAWVSLPCLLVFVTGSGTALGRRPARPA